MGNVSSKSSLSLCEPSFTSQVIVIRFSRELNEVCLNSLHFNARSTMLNPDRTISIYPLIHILQCLHISILQILRQILAGLAHLHSQGIIHSKYLHNFYCIGPDLDQRNGFTSHKYVSPACKFEFVAVSPITISKEGSGKKKKRVFVNIIHKSFCPNTHKRAFEDFT